MVTPIVAEAVDALVNPDGQTTPSVLPVATDTLGQVGGESNPREPVIYTIMGDANLDGQVGLLDWDVIKANFGSTTAPWTMGDVNGDGHVNLLDYNIVKTHFGQTATVPEVPAMAVAALPTLTARELPAPSGSAASPGASMAAWTWTPTVTGAVAEREKIDAAGLVLEPNLSVVDWSSLPSIPVAAL